LSIFHEMALAATVHNLKGGAGVVDPWTVLELATWRGAELLGIGDEVGRLETGRKADLVVLQLASWGMEPAGDPAATVVFGGDLHAVRHVLVDGVPVVRDGTLASGNARAIMAEARAAADSVARRLGWS
jgi:5-methylthioadenosine/S-adenosylhomocysteine deaminase